MQSQAVDIREVKTRPGAVLPEAVDPKRRKWSVGPVKTSPLMNFSKRTLEVPLDESEDSASIRAHEMAHVWKTPSNLYGKAPDVPGLLVNAVEDGRINSALQDAGVAAPRWNGGEPRAQELVSQTPLLGATMAAASEGTGDESLFGRLFAEAWGEEEAAWLARQLGKLHDGASADATVSVARAIHGRYSLGEDSPGEGEPGEGEGGEGEASESESHGSSESKFDSGESEPSESESDSSESDSEADSSEDSSESVKPDAKSAASESSGRGASESESTGERKGSKPPTSDGKELADLPPEISGVRPTPKPSRKRAALEKLLAEVDASESDLVFGGKLSESELIKSALTGYLANDGWSVGGGKTWCKMTIVEPRRTIRLKHGKGKGRSAQYYGRAPRYPHRMATDKQIFSSKRGSFSFPGTVLIDTSGSMALSDVQLERIVTAYPAATVAAYASDRSHNGTLKILAKDGKRIAGSLKAGGGGNGVDGPALAWLAKQPRPRIWICDGWVTGIADMSGKRLIRECRERVARDRIIPFRSVECFLSALAGGA